MFLFQIHTLGSIFNCRLGQTQELSLPNVALVCTSVFTVDTSLCRQPLPLGHMVSTGSRGFGFLVTAEPELFLGLFLQRSLLGAPISQLHPGTSLVGVVPSAPEL